MADRIKNLINDIDFFLLFCDQCAAATFEKKELYDTREEIASSFDLRRVSPSPTMFDDSKLLWMNGNYLRKMDVDTLAPLVYDHLRKEELLPVSVAPDSDLVKFIVNLFQGSMEVINDASREMTLAISYPLEEVIKTEEAAHLLEEDGGFKELAQYIIDAYDTGEFPDGSSEDHAALWKTWIKAAGKATKRKGLNKQITQEHTRYPLHMSTKTKPRGPTKLSFTHFSPRAKKKILGKGLFHPVRLALTGKMSGPDVGQLLRLLNLAEGTTPLLIPLSQRIETLRSLLSTL